MTKVSKWHPVTVSDKGQVVIFANEYSNEEQAKDFAEIAALKSDTYSGAIDISTAVFSPELLIAMRESLSRK